MPFSSHACSKIVQIKALFSRSNSSKLTLPHELYTQAPLILKNPVLSPHAGGPIPGTDLKVVHPDTRQELPDGQQGLLLARGPGVSVGYFDDDAATAAAFADGWFDTGDLGWRVPQVCRVVLYQLSVKLMLKVKLLLEVKLMLLLLNVVDSTLSHSRVSALIKSVSRFRHYWYET